MKENTLTDKEFWENYWENKTELAVPIPKNFLFGDILSAIVEKYKPQNALELGGFPGYYAVYLKKYYGIHSGLLDYFIHRPLVDKLLEVNKLTRDSIEIIETDLFQFRSPKLYDLVYSFGLIEHFDDPKPVLEKHVDLLKKGGILYLTLPNFRGVNGWIQKHLDPENLAKHNLKTMDPSLLNQYLSDLGLEVLECRYFGKFTVWLEDEKHKPLISRIIKGTVWWVGKILTRPFQLNSQIFSPYISLMARKN
jgi:SAM-dependent methyltransferase